MEILRRGLIENEKHLTSLTLEFNELVIPNDDDTEITHFWVISGKAESDPPILYLGTPDTFATCIGEERKPSGGRGGHQAQSAAGRWWQSRCNRAARETRAQCKRHWRKLAALQKVGVPPFVINEKFRSGLCPYLHQRG